MAAKISPNGDYGNANAVMMVPMNQVATTTQHAGNQLYGGHPGIQPMNFNEVKLLYRAEFEPYCCSSCVNPSVTSCYSDKSRVYFHVYENAYERNTPLQYMECCTCACISFDIISKSYFDRGVYDQQGCHRSVGCVKGAPSVFAGSPRRICFCTECPDTINNWLNCYCPFWCGDRISVIPFDTVCCCIPMRGCWCNNCCGLYGVKDGDPLIYFPFVQSLRIGTGDQLAAQLEAARANWSVRTGFK